MHKHGCFDKCSIFLLYTFFLVWVSQHSVWEYQVASIVLNTGDMTKKLPILY